MNTQEKWVIKAVKNQRTLAENRLKVASASPANNALKLKFSDDISKYNAIISDLEFMWVIV